jgi:hypothetical protein
MSGLSSSGWWKSGKHWRRFPLSHNLRLRLFQLSDQARCWKQGGILPNLACFGVKADQQPVGYGDGTTLGGLPAARSLCWNTMKSGS